MNARAIFRGIAAVLVTLAAARADAASQFHYSIPPGWRDLLVPGSQDAGTIPQAALADAASGRFAVYAIDPANSTEKRVGASFNAVETGPSGRPTDEAMDIYATGLARQMRATGLTAGVVESHVFSMNGVDVGTATFDIDSEQGGNRMLIQYLITGSKASTVLTYAAPKEEFAKYLPVFRASVRATTGGGAGASSGGFNWKQFFAVGAFAALVGIIIAVLRKALAGSKKGEALEGAIKAATGRPAAPAAPAAKKASYTWKCPGCGKPVPLRIDQCRCGTAKPA